MRLREKRKVRVIAEKVEAYNLEPGDIYSELGPEYWSQFPFRDKLVGEHVFMRTYVTDDEEKELVYRLTVVPEGLAAYTDRAPGSK